MGAGIVGFPRRALDDCLVQLHVYQARVLDPDSSSDRHAWSVYLDFLTPERR
jgi:hypothetical protein